MEHVKNDPNYKGYVCRLGNLLILESDINQKVKDKDFSVKISEYKNSGLYYTLQISSTYNTWDFTTIENRQATLSQSQTAVNVWYYI
jgi:hypothetical protein